jgi:exonuclease SbcC
VNYWRAKGEEFTGEMQEYRDRLAALRREIIERDALIEKLRDTQQTDGAAAVPAPAESFAAPTEPSPTDSSSFAQAEIEDLRAQLADRDRRVVDLQAELVATRETQYGANPDHSLEIQARIETLSRQVATFDTALNEAHTGRAALKSDLAAARAELEQAQRTAREAQADAERARAMLEEREHRIVELSAEIESTRQRAAAEHDALSAAHDERERLRAAVSESRPRVEQLGAELEQLRQQLAQQSQSTDDAIAASQSAHTTLAEREAQLGALRGQVEAYDRELNDRSRRISELEHAVAEQRRELEHKDQELGQHAHERVERERELAGHDERLTERNRALASLTEELEQARAMLEASDRELTSMRDTLLGANRELEQLRNYKQHFEGALADALARADDSAAHLARAREEVRELADHRAQLERQRDEISEQVTGLEAELREEKENAENLGEIANERRELMTKLQEKVEEAEERYEEAKYRLGKAAHFERLVKRRKSLISKLLAALRQKQKANTALKAGLDGLRTYKAGAEMNQQKLLQRIDALKVQIQEAEEAISRHHGSTHAKDELATSETKVTTLEARLNAQAEVIQALETDLKAARATAKSGDDKNHEIERLHKELETKSKAIAQLEADADDQQRKLAKLRGSESETMRLKAMTEKDRSSIDALEREVAQLREALARHSADGGAGASSAELESKLRDREQSVTRLMGTIKEHEATIKKLNESAESWKRKYQFLASDSPDAYKTAAEK